METASLLHGRYALTRLIGRGGMGEVWEARDSLLGTQVAAKIVPAADPDIGPRLRHEAMAVAALNHPGIVSIHDAGIDGDVAFLVMALLPGRDLATVLEEGPLPLDDALFVGERVASALAAAHAAGVVHRDIKPANIIVDGRNVTVVDFGITGLARHTDPHGTAYGTAAHMAPERARGDESGPAADIYALGCLLTVMVAGRPPFKASTADDLLRQHVTSRPPWLSDLTSDISPDLDRLVAAMLDKEPDRRPTAAAVAARLAALRSAHSWPPSGRQAPPQPSPSPRCQ